MILCTTAVLTAAVSQETGRLAEPVGQPYTGDDATGPHVLGYWPFDGDQPLVDASGKGHDIVLQGAVVAPDGRFGGALVSGRGWPDADVPHQARIKNAPALTPAGAFTIDGLGGAFVRGLDGDPHTVVGIGLPLLRLEPDVQRPIRHALVLVIIAAVGWLLVRIIGAAAEILSRRLNLDSPDNLRARRAQTQAMIAGRVSAVVIITITVAVMLTTFPQVRTLGASLLASAGIAGLVLGFAAQQALANLIAGVQIALAEPIRLDDVVVVEGEWGRIEEITFTYVVVRSWDQRRLVLPISYFTQTPFENWTRQRADLVGAVSLHVDYSAPLDELREELERTVTESPLWDGRTVGLQAVDAHERTIELRALVSGRSSGDVWDLRCAVRERLVGFLQRHHPGALPRVRAEVAAAPDGAGVRVSSDIGVP